MCRTDRLCSQAGVRSEEVSLISNQELEVSNWRNLVCSSSVPDFLARNRYFLARKYTVNGIYRTENPQSREENRRAENSTVEQTRAEKKRVDITAEQNKIEN